MIPKKHEILEYFPELQVLLKELKTITKIYFLYCFFKVQVICFVLECMRLTACADLNPRANSSQLRSCEEF